MLDLSRRIKFEKHRFSSLLCNVSGYTPPRTPFNFAEMTVTQVRETFVGKKCAKKHSGERYADNGRCCECEMAQIIDGIRRFRPKRQPRLKKPIVTLEDMLRYADNITKRDPPRQTPSMSFDALERVCTSLEAGLAELRVEISRGRKVAESS